MHDFGAHCGTAAVGDVLGELALVHSAHEHATTALVGATGAALLCIDRALFRHFADAPAEAPATESARVAATLRAACCRRILMLPASDRTAQDVQALVAFLHPLQVRFA